MDYKDEIKEFIVENFLFGDSSELSKDSDFFKNGIVDSTGVLELICFIEETYNIVVEDEDVTLKNFSSINSIADYLEEKVEKIAD